jgi:hypothetical protein
MDEKNQGETTSQAHICGQIKNRAGFALNELETMAMSDRNLRIHPIIIVKYAPYLFLKNLNRSIHLTDVVPSDTLLRTRVTIYERMPRRRVFNYSFNGSWTYLIY